jgi:hypothetical protein
MNGLNSTGTRSNWFCGWGSKLKRHLYLRVVEWTFSFTSGPSFRKSLCWRGPIVLLLRQGPLTTVAEGPFEIT